jgi:2-amino-4-hydroxy-6-hydroxymethyldihydropteridine diphosphokinase
MERVFLGLGSNLGDRAKNIRRAVRLVGSIGRTRVVSVSSLYETEPVGYADQPDFINAAVEIETVLTPRELLCEIKGIERSMGRKKTFRFGPRVIDIDILLFGNLTVDEPDLVIPHPRMLERRFVLMPLVEIAPQAIHPVSGETIASHLKNIGTLLQ